jgi:hypothetical protein
VIDTNDRMVEGYTLVIPAGSEISDGQSFDLTDGISTIRLEYDDLTIDTNSLYDSVQSGNLRVPFRSDMEDFEVARVVRDTINDTVVQSIMAVSAAIDDGTDGIVYMDFDDAGRLWEIEHGPAGGDELNLVQRGANYGWPVRSNGDNYDGSNIPDHTADDGFTKPVINWSPVIAPGNMVFYDGDLFEGMDGDLIVAGLKTQALIRISFDGETAREVARYDMGNRIRQVVERGRRLFRQRQLLHRAGTRGGWGLGRRRCARTRTRGPGREGRVRSDPQWAAARWRDGRAGRGAAPGVTRSIPNASNEAAASSISSSSRWLV